ncbi:hypothetical protein MCEMAEM4_03371 [Burkholderiaceae bacterium]
MKALPLLIPIAKVVTVVCSPLESVTTSPLRLVNAIDADICKKPAKLISA